MNKSNQQLETEFKEQTLEWQVQESKLQRKLNQLQIKFGKIGEENYNKQQLNENLVDQFKESEKQLKDLYVKYDKMEKFLKGKLQQMTQQHEDQLQLKTIEQNKNKILNDGLIQKQQQTNKLEKELKAYKLSDQQQQQQIKTLNNQYSYIFQELQNVQSSFISEQGKSGELQKQLNKQIQDNKDQLVLMSQKDDQIKSLEDSEQKQQYDFEVNENKLIEMKKLLDEQQIQNEQLTMEKLNFQKQINDQITKIKNLEQDSAILKEELKKTNDQANQLKEENNNLEDHAHQVTLQQLEQENILMTLQLQNDESKIIIKQQNEEIKKFKYQQGEIQRLEQELASQNQQLEDKTKQFNIINIKLTQITQVNEKFKHQITLKEREIKQMNDEIFGKLSKCNDLFYKMQFYFVICIHSIQSEETIICLISQFLLFQTYILIQQIIQ